MKTVTVETVRARLSYLEGLNARGVGTAVPQQQFETACLRELLALLVCRLMPITVKLPERYSCELGYSSPDPSGDMLDRDDVIATLAAAGINVEGE